MPKSNTNLSVATITNLYLNHQQVNAMVPLYTLAKNKWSYVALSSK